MRLNTFIYSVLIFTCTPYCITQQENRLEVVQIDTLVTGAFKRNALRYRAKWLVLYVSQVTFVHCVRTWVVRQETGFHLVFPGYELWTVGEICMQSFTCDNIRKSTTGRNAQAGYQQFRSRIDGFIPPTGQLLEQVNHEEPDGKISDLHTTVKR
jgi:hypothetical protein